MKLIRVSLAALALALVPAVAAAQPSGYYGQPPPPATPGGFHDRAGMPFAGYRYPTDLIVLAVSSITTPVGAFLAAP